MFLIDSATKKATSIAKRTFAELGFSERQDLQEWISDNPEILGEPLLIIQKEFDGFFDTNERLDLLALDVAGNLVVIENKLDDSGRDVVWQALKYVSYCALLKKSEIRDIYQKHLGSSAIAEDKLSEFFGNDDFENIKLNPQDGDQRLVLVAANFRKEVTTTVLWLRDHGMDVKCIRVTPYEDSGRIYLDAEQILPVQDIGDYQVRLSAKKQEDVAGSKGESVRKKMVKSFWELALPVISENISLYKGRSPLGDHWVNGSSGHSGIYYTLIRLKDKVRVEINIDTGDRDTNKKIYATLFSKKQECEMALGYEVDWLELPEKRASRIVGASYASELSDTETWQEAINWLSESMKKLYDVFKKPIDLAVKDI